MEEQGIPNEMEIQSFGIDPETGRDITDEYIAGRLKELKKVADKIIKRALAKYRKGPNRKKALYQRAYWEIHQKLGMGSIGPATAAAGPLMDEKKIKLAELLEVDEEDRI